MKEFVEKLIERLKEGSFAARSADSECNYHSFINLEKAVNIVEQLAKEFATDINVGNKNQGWIPCEERYPDTTEYILLSFSDFSIPVVGRWEEELKTNFYSERFNRVL